MVSEGNEKTANPQKDNLMLAEKMLQADLNRHAGKTEMTTGIPIQVNQIEHRSVGRDDEKKIETQIQKVVEKEDD